ncbi:hypothetical protein Syun_025637 [Stephania yunnanensis]|uniref:Uncharacterized protein n=1 Tax=Stephania yunnanensis TaxID=152371 RepID=A0AAP0HV12_9MAGN
MFGREITCGTTHMREGARTLARAKAHCLGADEVAPWHVPWRKHGQTLAGSLAQARANLGRFLGKGTSKPLQVPWRSHGSEWLYAKLQRRRLELTQATSDQPVDDEAVYFNVAGECPKGRVYGLGSLGRKKRRYAYSDASTSQMEAIGTILMSALHSASFLVMHTWLQDRVGLASIVLYEDHTEQEKLEDLQ